MAGAQPFGVVTSTLCPAWSAFVATSTKALATLPKGRVGRPGTLPTSPRASPQGRPAAVPRRDRERHHGCARHRATPGRARAVTPPAVAEAAADLSRFDSDAEYEFTLNLTLDAVLARLARYSPTADEAGLRRDH